MYVKYVLIKRKVLWSFSRWAPFERLLIAPKLDKIRTANKQIYICWAAAVAIAMVAKTEKFPKVQRIGQWQMKNAAKVPIPLTHVRIPHISAQKPSVSGR